MCQWPTLLLALITNKVRYMGHKLSEIKTKNNNNKPVQKYLLWEGQGWDADVTIIGRNFGQTDLANRHLVPEN